MKKHLALFAVPLFISIGMAAGPVFADNDGDQLVIRRDVDRFATLPDGVRFPEGIAANPYNGDIYVSTFDAASATNPTPRPNKLLRYDRHGRLIGIRDFGSDPLLGLLFDPVHRKVYICTVGDFSGTGSRIQRVDADLSNLQDVAFIPHIGAPAANFKVGNPDGSTDLITFGDNASVPNALAFDSKGNLYVSDSFQGAVFKITDPANCTGSCKPSTLSQNGLLATVGFPPFGANGLAFKNDNALFVANTGDDRVLTIDTGTGAVSVFSESLNGADGLVFDESSGLLWVCTNQADEVVALNANGKVVVKLGEFRGINRNGTPDGLLFPASPVIVGDEIFVTTTKGDEPEEDVTRWTVSSMRLPH
jgi:sugar lactone lactonase YvrE